MNYLFTSESVTPGHPDKMCDQIADAILDAALTQDKYSKMAIECTIKDNFVLIYGEATTSAKIDYASIAKAVIKDIGYNEEFEVMTKISSQSHEINHAVCVKDNIHAGDQGMMFGYATDETKDYMPLSIELAHQLAKQLTKVYKTQQTPILKPDGKTQVTVEYEENKIKRIDTIVVSTQHEKHITNAFIQDYIMEHVIYPVTPSHLIDKHTKFFINPSGSFTVGGPFGDSGTTGRKIIVDTYGGHGRIGGGCFSSKDPSKVDRSAAYYARYVAKNVVAHKLAKRCEIQVAYAIGQSSPVSIMVETFNTNLVSMEIIHEFIKKHFHFEVSSMIQELDLCRPIYRQTATFGHFGRDDIDLPWESIIQI